ncbi:hypothetical protein IF2G_01138 [Cordyceps javanica]|nr:hypothetical protein IF2G_01138 [Cordyceps javanica]
MICDWRGVRDLGLVHLLDSGARGGGGGGARHFSCTPVKAGSGLRLSNCPLFTIVTGNRLEHFTCIIEHVIIIMQQSTPTLATRMAPMMCRVCRVGACTDTQRACAAGRQAEHLETGKRGGRAYISKEKRDMVGHGGNLSCC